MFSKPTVFVVGAGAGYDYNMPLGSGLKEKIAAKLRSGDETMVNALYPVFSDGPRHYFKEYTNTKNFIAGNMELAESIDNFLHTHSANEKLVAIGKVAIAACILDAERGWDIAPRKPLVDGQLSYSTRTVNNRDVLKCTRSICGENAG